MIVKINIGLKIDATGFIIPADLALSVLAANQLYPLGEVRVAQSDTEPTLVGTFEFPGREGSTPAYSALIGVTQSLQQDAVAVVFPSGAGRLIGLGAHKWNDGVFDRAFFIEP